jgi:hypothetical protein
MVFWTKEIATSAPQFAEMNLVIYFFNKLFFLIYLKILFKFFLLNSILRLIFFKTVFNNV